jgi:hypothetical protein
LYFSKKATEKATPAGIINLVCSPTWLCVILRSCADCISL